MPCPKCQSVLPHPGNPVCPVCGTSWHWHERAGTLRQTGNAFSPVQAQALVNGLLAARWYATLQRSV